MIGSQVDRLTACQPVDLSTCQPVDLSTPTKQNIYVIIVCYYYSNYYFIYLFLCCCLFNVNQRKPDYAINFTGTIFRLYWT